METNELPEEKKAEIREALVKRISKDAPGVFYTFNSVRVITMQQAYDVVESLLQQRDKELAAMTADRDDCIKEHDDVLEQADTTIKQHLSEIAKWRGMAKLSEASTIGLMKQMDSLTSEVARLREALTDDKISTASFN